VTTQLLRILGKNEQREVQMCRHIEAASDANIEDKDVATTSRSMRIPTTAFTSRTAMKPGAGKWLKTITMPRSILVVTDGQYQHMSITQTIKARSH